jgi:hypothetical protein
MSQEIIYEPHPVSPERKAELRAKKLKIIDKRFDPKGKEADGEKEETLQSKMKKCSNKNQLLEFAKTSFDLDLDESLTRKELETAINDKYEKLGK